MSLSVSTGFGGGVGGGVQTSTCLQNYYGALLSIFFIFSLGYYIFNIS